MLKKIMVLLLLPPLMVVGCSKAPENRVTTSTSLVEEIIYPTPRKLTSVEVALQAKKIMMKGVRSKQEASEVASEVVYRIRQAERHMASDSGAEKVLGQALGAVITPHMGVELALESSLAKCDLPENPIVVTIGNRRVANGAQWLNIRPLSLVYEVGLRSFDAVEAWPPKKCVVVEYLKNPIIEFAIE